MVSVRRRRSPDRFPQQVARLLQDVVEADQVSCHLEPTHGGRPIRLPIPQKFIDVREAQARHDPAERHGSAQGPDIFGAGVAVDVRVEVHVWHRIERARAYSHRQSLTLRALQSGDTYNGTKGLLWATKNPSAKMPHWRGLPREPPIRICVGVGNSPIYG
jgi:hypothetical protein